MVPKTPLATRPPGLCLSAGGVVGAPELDRIELSNQQIEATPANKALKNLLTQYIKEARTINAAKIIAEEEAALVRQLAKPAKAHRRQLCGGLLLSSKHLAKLYHKHMELDKKKAEAAAKRKETKGQVRRKIQSKTNQRRETSLNYAEGAITSRSDEDDSESTSDEEMVDNQPYQATNKVSIPFS